MPIDSKLIFCGNILECREHVETLEVDACMVATGRVPNTKNMGLEDRGIVTNRGFVAVNEKMQVMTQAGELSFPMCIVLAMLMEN